MFEDLAELLPGGVTQFEAIQYITLELIWAAAEPNIEFPTDNLAPVNVEEDDIGIVSAIDGRDACSEWGIYLKVGAEV